MTSPLALILDSTSVAFHFHSMKLQVGERKVDGVSRSSEREGVRDCTFGNAPISLRLAHARVVYSRSVECNNKIAKPQSSRWVKKAHFLGKRSPFSLEITDGNDRESVVVRLLPPLHAGIRRCVAGPGQKRLYIPFFLLHLSSPTNMGAESTVALSALSGSFRGEGRVFLWAGGPFAGKYWN